MRLIKWLKDLVDTICSVSMDIESALNTFEERFAAICKGLSDRKPLSSSTQNHYRYLAERYIAEWFAENKGKVSDENNSCSFNPDNRTSGWVETTKISDTTPDIFEERSAIGCCSRENFSEEENDFSKKTEDGSGAMELPEISAETAVKSKSKSVNCPVYTFGSRVKGRVTGIDVHKRELFVTFIDDNGPLEVSECGNKRTWIVPNNVFGLNNLMDIMNDYNIKVVGFESTSIYWIPLAKHLKNNDVFYVCANALELKSVQGKKTDKIDSMRIALATRDGRLSESKTLPENIDLRDFLRLARNNYHRIHGIQNKILDELWLIGIDPTEIYSNTPWSSPAFNQFLDYLAGNRSKEELSYPRKDSDLFPKLGKLKIDRNSKIALYQEWAERQLEMLKVYRGRAAIIRDLIAQRFLLMNSLQNAEKEIDNECNTNSEFKHFMDIILTFPGITKIEAAIILTETNFTDFPTSKQYAKYCGLVPRVEQSGRKRGKYAPKIKMGKVSRHGNRVLRVIYKSLALRNISSRVNPSLSGYYKKLKSKNKKFHVIGMAVAHKISVMIWNMITTKTPYIPYSYDNNGSNTSTQVRLSTDRGTVVVKRRIYDKFTGILRLYDHEFAMNGLKVLESSVVPVPVL